MNDTQHPWRSLWTPASPTNSTCGWVDTFDEAEAVRQSFQETTSLTFVGGKRPANFGHNKELTKKNYRIRYPTIGDNPSDGVPFVTQSRMEWCCQFGKDKHKVNKLKAKAIREEELKGDHPSPRTRKKMSIQITKKKDCPAKIILLEVIRFPEFKIRQVDAKTVKAAQPYMLFYRAFSRPYIT